MTVSKLGQHLTDVIHTLLMGFVLMGCSVYPDVNTDLAKNNKATFRQDALDCAHSYPESGSGIHVKQRIACMNLKGWH
ncbi:hypothetical protein FD977_01520 [Polynucleobacter sp. AP-Elch-400A-B2]|uniref:hypothetical protein n=1 Tax=Polynucleobacter sp. AP-Elch-400A-B2 TaxID=2576930 RepID=UPI001BFDE84A|nr:hypothetical protein [Polynucleobacter sp. AP-Elch-400A-B2]QWE24966.1 hypothetical protein FD977_01520 [Polynucleobacter sp. AP-Elch-400A-B2]